MNKLVSELFFIKYFRLVYQFPPRDLVFTKNTNTIFAQRILQRLEQLNDGLRKLLYLTTEITPRWGPNTFIQKLQIYGIV